VGSNTIDQALNVYVKASTEMQDEIGARLFYVEAERDAAYPYAVYFLVSDPHTPMAYGNTLTGQARIQYNVYDDDRYNALEISDKIRDRIHLCADAAMDGVTVYSVMCSGTIVEPMEEQDIFRARFDALIEYKDA
jgi:hypothetical protein